MISHSRRSHAHNTPETPTQKAKPQTKPPLCQEFWILSSREAHPAPEHHHALTVTKFIWGERKVIDCSLSLLAACGSGHPCRCFGDPGPVGRGFGSRVWGCPAASDPSN